MIDYLVDVWKCNSCGGSFEEDKVRKDIDTGSYILYLCKDCVMRVDYLIGDDKDVG